jgi:hypothetical protein
MEAILERCCGLDVHKREFVACVLVGGTHERPAGRADDGRPDVIASECNTIATDPCADPSPEAIAVTRYDRGPARAGRW